MIDLTAGIDTEKITKQFKELREKARNTISGIVTDSERMDAAMQQVTQTVSQMENATGVSASKTASAIEDLSQNIQIQKRVIHDLRSEYLDALASMDNSSLNRGQKTILSERMRSVREELNAEKDALIELERNQKRYIEYTRAAENEQNKATQSLVAFETQVRKVRDQMGYLILEGKKNTTEYKNLEAELGRLGTVYKELQRIQNASSTGGTQWVGIISGVQGLTGAFTAYQGIMGLVVKDNEKLQAIQTKIQGTLAILMGMQQLSNTLHQTSAFRITTLTKVSELWNAINTKTATGLNALGLSAKAANIATKALYGTITLGLSVAVGAAISWYSKWSNKQDDVKKKQEELAKSTANYNRAVGESAGKSVAAYKSLQATWNSLGNDLNAKNKYILENADAFKQLGVQVSNVRDAENLFVKNEAAFIRSLNNRARATASMDLAVKSYSNMLTAEQEIEQLTQQRSTARGLLNMARTKSVSEGAIFYAADGTGFKSKRELDQYIRLSNEIKLTEQRIKDLTKARDKDQRVAESQIKASVRASVSAENALKEAGISPEKTKAERDALKAAETSQKKAADIAAKEEINATKKLYDSETALLRSRITDKRELIEFDLEQTLAAIEKEKQAYVDLQKAAGKSIEEIDTSAFDIRKENVSAVAYGSMFDADVESMQRAEEQLNKLLDDYATYAQRRQKIEEDAQKAISRIQEKNTSGQYDANIAEVKRKALKELQLISEAEASDMQKTSSILVDLFGEASEKSVSEINRITTAIQEMLSYIATTNMEDITDKFGFTSSQLKSLKSAPKDLEAIKNAVEDLRRASVQKNPFAALVKDLKALFATSKNAGDTAKKIADIGESASASADRIGTLTGQLSEMFEAMGNSSMSEAMNGAQDVMSSISNIGQGFAKGGIIGGIGAAVGEAAGWISKAFQANARHKAALKEIMNEVISQQREYNLLLMEQNLEYEKGITIFGSDTYGKAVNAISVMRDAYKQLQTAIKGTTDQQKKFARRESSNFVIDLVFGKYNAAKEAYAGLADIEVKTGHKKTGLFGWGKGKDIYSSILDVYPDLIDANGKFNASLAETIINSRKMSDEDKAALQNMIDLTNQAKDALDQVNDYLTGIFGDLGSTMTDALVDAFANGTDAAMAFVDSVSEMLEKMSKEMIYSVTLAPIFKKAQEDMLAAMEGADLTDEQRFNKYVEILDKVTQNALAQQGNFDALLEKYQEIAKKHGYNIFTPEQTEQQATSKGFQTMSQDTGDELNGRFTVMTDIMAKSKDIQQNIMGATFDIRDLAMAANNHLQMISRNTAVLSDMNARLKVIEENTGYLK